MTIYRPTVAQEMGGDHSINKAQVRDNGYVLEFKYPTAEERKYLRIVNRDMTEQEKNKLFKRQNQLEEVVQELLSGEIHKEDLPHDVIESLRKALGL